MQIFSAEPALFEYSRFKNWTPNIPMKKKNESLKIFYKNKKKEKIV